MAKIKVTTIEGLAESIEGLKTHIDKRFNEVDNRLDGIDDRFDEVIQSVAKGFENEHEYFETSFNSLESRMATKVDLEELNRKVERIDIRVDEIHEVTVGLEKGELQTGKSMRKMQKIVSRLSHETR